MLLPSAAALTALAGLCALVYLLWFCHKPSSLLKTLVKTAAVLLLAGAAWRADAPALLLLALTLCAVGDFFLSREGESAFLTGVAAFAAGHIAYIALFLGVPGSDIAAIPIAAIIALLLFAVAMMNLLYRHAGPLRLAVLFYVPVIVGMGLAAMAVPAAGALWLVLPAALLFMASDTVLASELFLLRPDHPMRRITPFAIWTLYWLAQLGFLMGFAAL